MKMRWAGALGCALAMVACGRRDASAPEPEVSLSKDLPKRAPRTFAQYAPLVREVGPLGGIPTSIVVELTAPAADKKQVGRAVHTGFAITPALPGSLRWTAPSQLTFTPEAPGFAPDVAYKVELRHLETAEGVVATPSPITHTFTTPAFAFAGASPIAFDAVAKKAAIEVRFTGPVAPTAAAAIEVTVDGRTPATVAPVPNPLRNTVVVEVTAPSLAIGSVIGVVSKKGVSGAAGGSSGPIEARHVLGKDRPASIKGAQLVEGSGGFYLEVTCDDTAAPAGSRGVYVDDEVVSKLSQRCQLTDEALARVHVDPPVKKMYLTSGRAGFRVFGDFRRGAYAIKVDAGAPTKDGGVVAAAWGKTFTVPLRTPRLELAGSGRYLPRSAWSRLGIRHTNVEAARLVVRRVPPENLAFYMSADDSDGVDERTSDIILDHTVPLPGAAVDASGMTWVDIGKLVPSTTRGVLEVRVVGVGAEAASQLLLTDLSLVAKKTAPPDKPAEQTVRVWALGMADASPATGVEVSLVRKSGTVVARCTTGADGCTLVAKSPDADPAVPFAIVARRGDDVTYLRYADLRVELGGTSGVANDGAPYRAAVYGDRGLYRPGETAHVVAIVHDTRAAAGELASRAPEAPLPVDIEIFDPRAKMARRIARKTNAAGLVAFEHAFPAFADTGLWRVVVSVAGTRLATHHLQVEEFVPERMRVSASPVRPEALMGEVVELDVSAQYLFGGSAIDSGVRVQCALSPAAFSPRHNAELTYGVRTRGRSVPLPEAKDQLDPHGKTRIACPAPPPGAALVQTAVLSANVSVEEAGSGRATMRSTSALLHPERYYLGLKGGTARASAGVPFAVEGLIVGWDGLPLASGGPDAIDVELLRLEHDYGYSNDDDEASTTHFDRSTRITTEKKQRVTVTGGKFRVDVTPGEAEAGYVVRVSAGKARTELVLPAAVEIASDEVAGPAGAGQLHVDLPAEIRAGQDVMVKVRAPYKGKLLWSLETDRVIASAWRDVPAAGEATWSFRLPAFAPNVYASALLVKDPHAESSGAFLPERAYGIASARVAATDFTQSLAISAPKEVRSGGSLAIALDAGPLSGPGFATVAVVDEGILSLTGYTTPDPLAQLFARRELGVETYETIGWTMLHRPAGVAARTGGGDGGADGGKLAGTRIRPTKPVALFSGVVPIGADGKVSVPFQLPAYRGKVRVMAIVATPTRIGRAEASVIVRDPLIAQVTFPRFVTLGDELDIPVFVTNLSGGPLDVDVTVTADALDVPGLTRPAGPPFAFTRMGEGWRVKVEDGRSETVVFHAKALHAVGGAKLRVVAVARGLEVRDEVDVPFLPAGARERVVARTRVAAGPLDLAAQKPLAGWVPTSERTTFWMTSNPYAESLQHLSYLAHYPYGCIEQTVSAARPLLYLGDLVKDVEPHQQIAVPDLVQAGIQRVLSMETPSGGFGYWPGASEPLAWATAYAADFLLDAKKAGYPVPEDRLTEVLAWVETRAGKYERGEAVAAKPGTDDQAEPYLHLVLAKSGRARKARILRLLEGIASTATSAPTEDRYVLQAALWLAGDRRFDKQLRTVDTSPISAERGTGMSFYSDRRRRGLMLSVFHDLFGNDPAGEPLAARVAESLGGSSPSYTTQELVWGITGLGKWVAGHKATGTAGGTLRGDGAAIAPRAGAAGTWTVARASEYKALALDVPASAAGMWLVTTSEGVRAGPPRLGGSGLAVKRTYRRLDGAEVDLAAGSLRLGDVVFVEVALENTTAARISNLALVDRLPAGFEIENARLGRSIALAWSKEADQWTLDHMNLRDDHLEAFGALGPKEKRVVVYAIRAVTSGTFAVPPVEAEAMYDPTTWARAQNVTGGKAVVGGPWTARTL